MTSRIKLTLIFVIFFTYSSDGQGFRSYPWGTPKSEIVQENGTPPTEKYGNKYTVSYKNLPVAGIYSEHSTFFCFDDSNLFRMGGYYFKLKTEKERELVLDKMIKLYGQPKKVIINIFWPSKIGFENEYHDVWQTKDSIITLLGGPFAPPNADYVIKYYETSFFQKLYKKSKAGL
jgi:hypothetical protein